MKISMSRILAVILCLAVTFTACSSNPTVQQNSQVKADQLLNIINLSKNPDGGYKLIDDIGLNADLHSTYHALKIMELMDRPIGQADFDKIVEWVERDADMLLFDANKFDTLSSVYYYLEILQMKDKSPQNIEHIQSYVQNLQTKFGSFAFSEKQKADLNQQESEEFGSTLLPTYMAMVSLERLGQKPLHADAVKKWTESKISTFNFGETTVINSDYLLLLTKISKAVGANLNSYQPQIESFFRTMNEQFATVAVTDGYNLLDLDSMMEINKYLGQPQLDHAKQIGGHLTGIQAENGGFPIAAGDEPNILTTYIALKFLQSHQMAIPNGDKIERLLKKNRSAGIGYRPLIELPSSIVDTYYVQQIRELNGVEKNDDLKNYLQAISDSQQYQTFNIESQAYYFELASEEKMVDRNDPNLQASIEAILEDVEVNANLDNVRELFSVVTDLQALQAMQADLGDALERKLIENVKQEPADVEGMPELTLLHTCFQLQLMTLLGVKEDTQTEQKLELLTESLAAGLPASLNSEKMMYLYYIVSTLQAYGVKDFDLAKVEQEVQSCATDSGLYRLGTAEDRVSYRSSYYALSVLSYLKEISKK